jgi:hypothetical protein
LREVGSGHRPYRWGAGYNEGLTTEQIAATIANADADRKNGTAVPVEARLLVDAPDACGAPADVLRAAGRAPR